MEDASVPKMRRYPPAPEGFEEPLLPANAPERTVAEYPREVPRPMRDLDSGGRTGEVSRASGIGVFGRRPAGRVLVGVSV
ncbi:hypothetical protein GBA65_06425 [Rubrobacter marinus]|uniref:Uncharacterized protein n=1 Tax=Rubrobacter marinus TaxID=2653852 RepID=A0A6G8PVH9_9ACTN|nr:hypothetical protein [Rubrobacter marinus]QIN78206.1 hypothetical protein GBA65_06425 [Rubrobacter marinus]